ncbi:hypothetical protein MMC17_009294 [Xylographa soralifera]|nr:hypothetical protein [Xylographa soralifera]
MILLSHLHHATCLCILLALVLATGTKTFSEQNQTSSRLTPRSLHRRVFFEVSRDLALGEGSSSGSEVFPAKTAIWIEGAPFEDPLKIDLRLVRYTSGPALTMFTPYIQELPFEFPHIPPGSYNLGDWFAIQPGVEIFSCAETRVSNMEIMRIKDGQGILFNRIKSDKVLTTALIDPNIFMYDFLLDLVGYAGWNYERLVDQLVDSRTFFHKKNEAWVQLMPLAVYQAGNGGKHQRYFDIRDAEKPISLEAAQKVPFINSIADEVMPEAQNPYVTSWGTVDIDSSAQPPNWTRDLLDFLNLGYFPATTTRST